MTRTKRRHLNVLVNQTTLHKILEIGHEFDVNKNGHYDARLGCVNIWCSPDDKPTCWNNPITQGDLDYPRDYTGTIYWETKNNLASLYIEAEPFALLDRPERQLTDTEWEQVLDWLQDKAMFLVRFASIHPDTGIKCPFCSHVMPRSWNDLLELFHHIEITHEKHVDEIVLGDPTRVTVNGESFPLETGIL